MKLDKGIRELSLYARGKLATMYKRAFKREFSHTGNHRCWITLLEAELGGKIEPLTLPKDVFLRFCERYYHRNDGKRKSSDEKRVLSEFVEWLCEEYPEQVIKALTQSRSGKRIVKQVTGSV